MRAGCIDMTEGHGLSQRSSFCRWQHRWQGNEARPIREAKLENVVTLRYSAEVQFYNGLATRCRPVLKNEPNVELLRPEYRSQWGTATGTVSTPLIVPALRTLHISGDLLPPDLMVALTSFISKSGCRLHKLYIAGGRFSRRISKYVSSNPKIQLVMFNLITVIGMVDDRQRIKISKSRSCDNASVLPIELVVQPMLNEKWNREQKLQIEDVSIVKFDLLPRHNQWRHLRKPSKCTPGFGCFTEHFNPSQLFGFRANLTNDSGFSGMLNFVVSIRFDLRTNMCNFTVWLPERPLGSRNVVNNRLKDTHQCTRHSYAFPSTGMKRGIVSFHNPD
ncbi:hypothetical protein C8R43DRAFT_951895 [Mycena crocata]|nr:hypothetical protein C8R43DRAFT_951895 [Mycena crocata]